VNSHFRKKCIVPLLLSLSLTLTACSDSEEDTGEKSRLQEKQQQIAEEAREMIIVPIEKAKNADALSADRNQRMKDQIDEQLE